MGELFENIFVLVPVALIIFLRVFADGAWKRAEKTKTAAASADQVQSRPARPATAAPSPGQGRPLTRKETRQAEKNRGQEERKKAKPSRPAGRDLLGRLRNYLSGSLEQLVDQPEPLHFELEAQRRLGQYAGQTADSPGARTSASPGYKAGLPGAMEETAAVKHEAAVAYTLPGRLERLPPLKRAIVLAEVLGKPKSLQ